jgi:hypothetical protein
MESEIITPDIAGHYIHVHGRFVVGIFCRLGRFLAWDVCTYCSFQRSAPMLFSCFRVRELQAKYVPFFIPGFIIGCSHAVGCPFFGYPFPPVLPWLSYPSSPVLAVCSGSLFWQSVQLSCSASPVVSVLFCLSCLPVLFCLTCSAFPVLPFLFCLSCSACHFACPVLPATLPVPFCLSRSACPVLPVPFCLSRSALSRSALSRSALSSSACPILPLLFSLSCSGCPVLAVPFWRSCSRVLFYMSCSTSPVLPVLFHQSCSACPVLPVPFCLSSSACLLLPVLF